QAGTPIARRPIASTAIVSGIARVASLQSRPIAWKSSSAAASSSSERALAIARSTCSQPVGWLPHIAGACRHAQKRFRQSPICASLEVSVWPEPDISERLQAPQCGGPLLSLDGSAADVSIDNFAEPLPRFAFEPDHLPLGNGGEVGRGRIDLDTG